MNRAETPKRVLFVNHTARVSGAELSLLALIEHLDRARVTPILASPAGRLSERAGALGVEHREVRLRRVARGDSIAAVARELAHLTTGALALASLIRRERIDLVHANSTTAHISSGPAAALVRVPAVWHVRDLVDLGVAGHALFALSDAICCVSECVTDRIARYGRDRARVHTIHNGIDLARLRSLACTEGIRAGLGIAEDAPLVVHLAQFTPWKGHRFLLDALREVRRRIPDVRVLLAGEAMTPTDARYLDDLRHTVHERDMDETVRFSGWRDDPASLIAAGDLVVLPSKAEPFGRSALEAMALGKPVVGTDAGGLPELVKHNRSGLLVRYGDVNALADAIVTLLESPAERLRMGQNASADTERFDISNTVSRIHDLYDALLRPGAPKRLTPTRPAVD